MTLTAVTAPETTLAIPAPRSVPQQEVIDVVAAAVAGDRQARYRLMAHVEPAVVRYCRARLGCGDLATTVARRVCRTVVATLADLPDGAGIHAFVHRVAEDAVDRVRRPAGLVGHARDAQAAPARTARGAGAQGRGRALARGDRLGAGFQPGRGAPGPAPRSRPPPRRRPSGHAAPPPGPACRAPSARNPPRSRRAAARCGACAGSGPSVRPAAAPPARGTTPRRAPELRRPRSARRGRGRPRCRGAVRGASSPGRTSSRSSRHRPGRRHGERPPSRAPRRAFRRPPSSCWRSSPRAPDRAARRRAPRHAGPRAARARGDPRWLGGLRQQPPPVVDDGGERRRRSPARRRRGGVDLRQHPHGLGEHRAGRCGRAAGGEDVAGRRARHLVHDEVGGAEPRTVSPLHRTRGTGTPCSASASSRGACRCTSVAALRRAPSGGMRSTSRSVPFARPRANAHVMPECPGMR